MPRRVRLHFDNVPLHIVQRGHNRAACFFADDDYRLYLRWLGEALTEAGCALHAYTLMTNHVHLLLTPADAKSVPHAIMSLGRRYVRHINSIHQRTGTLWDGRYKSSLIQEETYFLQCQRYIEMNPVRAKIVAQPENYRWTSYRANALGQPALLNLTPHALYNALAGDELARQAAYRALFAGHVSSEETDSIRLALNHSQPVGNPHFHAEITRITGVASQVKPRGRPPVIFKAI